MTNSQGEVVWLADYEAWGAPHKEMCWGHSLASQDESYARVEGKEVWHDQKINPLQIEKEHLQPIRFQGQHFDVETGLHYNRFRYYDPDMGMFTSRDPIGLMGGLNVFAYAPNPTGWIDPLGLSGVAVVTTVGEAATLTSPSPAKVAVLVFSGGYWVGTKINNSLEANGLSIGSEIYDLTHPKENVRAIPQAKANTKDRNENQCTATISSRAARRMALKTAELESNPQFKPNITIAGSQPIAVRGERGWEQQLYKLPNTPQDNTKSYVVLSHHPADKQHSCPHWHVGYPKDIEPNNNSYISKSPYLPATNNAKAWKYQSDGLPAVEHKIEP